MNDAAFTTTDLGLAAWLLAARKLKLNDVKPQAEWRPDQSVADVIFDDPDGLGEDLQQSYLSGEAVVNALAYYSQLKFLKRRIYVAVGPKRGRP
jgi:hypothetical protein